MQISCNVNWPMVANNWWCNLWKFSVVSISWMIANFNDVSYGACVHILCVLFFLTVFTFCLLVCNHLPLEAAKKVQARLSGRFRWLLNLFWNVMHCRNIDVRAYSSRIFKVVVGGADVETFISLDVSSAVLIFMPDCQQVLSPLYTRCVGKDILPLKIERTL